MSRRFDNRDGINPPKNLLIAVTMAAAAGFLIAFLVSASAVPRSSVLSLFKSSCEKNMLRKYAKLEKENQELKDQLKVARLLKAFAKGQLLFHQQSNYVSSFGTMKSIRTNTLVFPDDSVNPRLSDLLSNISIDNELIITLVNANVLDLLEMWAFSIKYVGIKNYLVVALDDEVLEYCKDNKINVFKHDPDQKIDSIGTNGEKFAVSGLKFSVLREFLQMGFSVLLSDVDIVYLKNPFEYIYGDCDVEAMSDGDTNVTAYGSIGKRKESMSIWVYNSGFFYIRATAPSIELIDRVAARVEREGVWDQQAFNEEMFIPSHKEYLGVHISKRTMKIDVFMNSKTFFKMVISGSNMTEVQPVVVHLNYHPDKFERMEAVLEYFVNGEKDALKNFTLGYMFPGY